MKSSRVYTLPYDDSTSSKYQFGIVPHFFRSHRESRRLQFRSQPQIFNSLLLDEGKPLVSGGSGCVVCFFHFLWQKVLSKQKTMELAEHNDAMELVAVRLLGYWIP